MRRVFDSAARGVHQSRAGPSPAIVADCPHVRPRSARAARTASRFSPAWHLALGARGGGEMRGRRVTLTDVQTSSSLAPRHPASPVVHGDRRSGRVRSCSWHYGPACGKLLRGKSRLRPGPRFVVTTGIRPERVGTIRVQLTLSRRPATRHSRPRAHRGRGSRLMFACRQRSLGGLSVRCCVHAT